MSNSRKTHYHLLSMHILYKMLIQKIITDLMKNVKIPCVVLL